MQEKSFIKSNDEVTDFLRLKIEENLVKRRSLSSCGEVYSTAHLTECERRIMYRSYGVNVDEDVINLDRYKEWNYEALKNKWFSFLNSLPNVNVVMRDHVCADCNFNIGGIANIVKIGRKHVIFEVSSVDNSDFLYIAENGPRRNEVVDVMAKMWLNKINNGILVYDNVINGLYQIFHITQYENIIKSICNKCIDMNNYRINGKFPDRIYEDENGSECKICEYKQKCWKKGNNSS